ncbi:MAG: HypC/HybG/HupF family hydrogenase formation chaperone, partial [Geminicoccaceae bacterium]
IEMSPGDPLIRTGKVDFGGVIKEINLAFTPEAGLGDYVLVHVGFAISVLDEAEAKKVLDELAALDELEEAKSTLAGVPAS